MPRAEQVELSEMEATPAEASWAIREAYVIDPGTDTPGVKLLQRRRNERRERERAAADVGAESPLAKFARVWA